MKILEETLKGARDREKQAFENAKYLASRKDWIEQFPFVPTFDSERAFDPREYDTNNPDGFKKWSPLEGETFEDYTERSATYHSHKRRVEKHGFLAAFYENPSRFSPEFEAVYHIFEEEGAPDNPMAIARTYDNLKDWALAGQHDPDAIYEENAEVYDHDQQQRIIRNLTWLDRRLTLEDAIIGSMVNEANYSEGELPISLEVAQEIQKRVLEEISTDGFFEDRGEPPFAFNDALEKKLRAGDPLLVR